MAVTIYAAIDVGSYDVQMKIYEISAKNKIVVVDHLRYVLEIGKDTYTSGKVEADTINELCNVLKNFSDTMSMYRVSAYDAYSTSGIREAKNCQIILDRIKVSTGISVQLISNAEQRFIALKGLLFKNEKFEELTSEGTAVVDVGSGSIQISIYEKGGLITTRNLKLGTLRIRELLYSLSNDRDHFDYLINELIDNDIDAFKRMHLNDAPINNIIALGDDIVQFSRKGSENRLKEEMNRKQFMERFKSFEAKSPQQISDKLLISEEKASLIIPCVQVYKKVFEETQAQCIWIPNIDLCDGMAAHYCIRNKLLTVNHDFDKDVILSVTNMAKRYMTDMDYVEALQKNVNTIFRETKKLHGLQRRDEFLLQIATILSDIGKYVSSVDSSECAYDIITHSEIIGLSDEEREIVARIVKNNAINIFETAEDDNDLLIAKLTAILKLATAIDRSHKNKIKDISITLKDNKMYIKTKTKDDLTLEKGLFDRRAKYFEDVYGVRPIIKQSGR